jgi:hypothetical protein
MLNSVLLLPRILHGTHWTTKAAWEGWLARVLQEPEQAEEHFRLLELVDVDRFRHPIVLRDDPEGSVRPASLWRLNLIHQSLKVGCTIQDAIGPEAARVAPAQRVFILHGIRHYWFSLGLLDPELDIPAFFHRQPESREDFFLSILHQMLYWLADILRLLPRYHWGLWPYLDRLNPQNWCYLWKWLINLITIARPALDHFELLAKISAYPERDIVAALLAEGLILPTPEGRYRLNQGG